MTERFIERAGDSMEREERLLVDAIYFNGGYMSTELLCYEVLAIIGEQVNCDDISDTLRLPALENIDECRALIDERRAARDFGNMEAVEDGTTISGERKIVGITLSTAGMMLSTIEQSKFTGGLKLSLMALGLANAYKGNYNSEIKKDVEMLKLLSNLTSGLMIIEASCPRLKNGKFVMASDNFYEFVKAVRNNDIDTALALRPDYEMSSEENFVRTMLGNGVNDAMVDRFANYVSMLHEAGKSITDIRFIPDEDYVDSGRITAISIKDSDGNCSNFSNTGIEKPEVAEDTQGSLGELETDDEALGGVLELGLPRGSRLTKEEVKHQRDAVLQLITKKEYDEIQSRIIDEAFCKMGDGLVVCGAPYKIQHMLLSNIVTHIADTHKEVNFGLALTYPGEDGIFGRQWKTKVVREGTPVIDLVEFVGSDAKTAREFLSFLHSQMPLSLHIILTSLADGNYADLEDTQLSICNDSIVQSEFISQHLQDVDINGMRFKISDDARKSAAALIENGYRLVDIGTTSAKAAAIAVNNSDEELRTDNGHIIISDKAFKSAVVELERSGKLIRKDEKIQDDVKLVRELSKNMKSIVKGQDEAIDSIVRAVKIAKAGLNEEDKPIASLLFIGPTGTGKTESARQLAKALKRKFVRIDMGDYKDKTSVNKFLGASAGYVGYDDGSVLGKALKGNEHCVLLFDELEKADPSIFDVMMDMLDNAELTDNKGEKLNFKDAIIIMTSNVGAREMNKATAGFNSQSVTDARNDRGLSDAVEAELESTFKPEFINRFDAIVQFNKLSTSVAREIAVRMVGELTKNVVCDVRVTDACYDKLAEAATDIRFGAREIKRVISKELKSKLADLIIDNDFVENSLITLDVSDGEFKFCMTENH